jgi:hypothetical protein
MGGTQQAPFCFDVFGFDLKERLFETSDFQNSETLKL